VRLLYLAQKPVGEAGFEIVRPHVVGVVSNASPTGWWGTAGLAHTGLPFVDTDDARPTAILEFVVGLQADAIVSVQFPRLLSREVLDAVGGRAWNLHLAPLPKYRGFNGPTLALLAGDDSYGVTLHWVDADADTGDIAYSAEWPIPASATALSLYDEAERQGLRLLRLLYRRISADKIPPRHPQGPGGYWRRDAIDAYREIRSWEEVDRKARAFHFPPFPPAFIDLSGVKYWVTPASKTTPAAHGNQDSDRGFGK